MKERRLGFVWVKVVLKALFIFCYANLEFARGIKFEVKDMVKGNHGEESKLNLLR